jgi:hypothetical protein
MRKETLEEAAERFANNFTEDENKFAIEDFIAGAKWQQERSYSEEDMRASLADFLLINPTHLQMTSNGHGEFPDGYKLTEKGISYIIEQFKKK